MLESVDGSIKELHKGEEGPKPNIPYALAVLLSQLSCVTRVPS